MAPLSELFCLELSIALWLAHVVVQGVLAGRAVGNDYLTSNRDATPPGADNVPYARATRALRNYIENYVPFVAADLGLMVTHHASEWGATIWILARIAYLPIYVAGLSPARTIVWAISLVALVIMLVCLAL